MKFRKLYDEPRSQWSGEAVRTKKTDKRCGENVGVGQSEGEGETDRPEEDRGEWVERSVGGRRGNRGAGRDKGRQIVNCQAEPTFILGCVQSFRG